MDKYFQDYTVALVSELKAISPPSYVPPDDGAKPKTEMVLARSLVSNTRGYIERVVAQINGTYENGWYDKEINLEEALKWYQLAADQDYDGAQECVDRVESALQNAAEDS